MPIKQSTPATAGDHQPGKLLKLLRSLKGIKQSAAARQLGVKQQAISKLENSKKISNKKFAEIVAVFKFSAEEIETAKKFLRQPDSIV